MTLADLIATLELEDPDRKLPLGFANAYPYRDRSEDLAFELVADITIGEMLEVVRSALGRTFRGWDGAHDFVMVGHTECWLAVYGGRGEKIGPVLLTLLLISDQLVHTAATAARLGTFTQRKWGLGHG
jgi:hypothetical protein